VGLFKKKCTLSEPLFYVVYSSSLVSSTCGNLNLHRKCHGCKGKKFDPVVLNLTVFKQNRTLGQTSSQEMFMYFFYPKEFEHVWGIKCCCLTKWKCTAPAGKHSLIKFHVHLYVNQPLGLIKLYGAHQGHKSPFFIMHYWLHIICTCWLTALTQAHSVISLSNIG